MSYMKNTIAEILNNGYILASVDYRFVTQSKFPQSLQDCNQGLEYLYQQCSCMRHGDRNRMAVMGFFQLVLILSVATLAHNNSVSSLHRFGSKSFKIRGSHRLLWTI